MALDSSTDVVGMTVDEGSAAQKSHFTVEQIYEGMDYWAGLGAE